MPKFPPLSPRSAWQLWDWSCRHDMRRFQRALRDPRKAQNAALKSILGQAEGTAWAREYGMDSQSDYQAYRERVPVQEAHELERWTDRIMRGETGVLTRETIERLVPTSGTTGKHKLIPMTRRSRREFTAGIHIWLGDTMRNQPAIKSGRCYIATSPALDFTAGASAVPVGFAQDEAYLDPLGRLVLDTVLAVPLNVASLRGDAWREATRRHLREARDLRFLSLWHPGYLAALFNDDELAELAETWRDLTVISCWSDGACADPARKLMQHFPKATHSAKGLWLTEGIVSVPWMSTHPVALLSGFFEFEDPQGNLRLCDELEVGEIYRPVISNHAGLYRYRLGDLVKVTGYTDATPSLEWIGRADRVSDLCGEKLSEAQVAQALGQAGWSHFCRLMPVQSTAQGSYYLCIIPEEENGTFPLEKVEAELSCNPHYAWARTTGQLGHIRLLALKPQERSRLDSIGHDSKHPHRKAPLIMLGVDASQLVDP